ncbi:MAG: hypothetical protein ACK4NS_04335 [Saprospiraceae bacterium]
MKARLIFGLHLLLTVLAWAAPFLIDWRLLALILGAVMAQFWIFKRCLMNSQHGLEERDDATFYSYLFERMGWRPNRRIVKTAVRVYLYPALIMVGFLWQHVFCYEPLLF